MTKVKILHLIKSLGRGGAETLLPESLALHDKNAFEFYYIYFLPWKNQMVQAIQDRGGHVSCLQASSNLAMLMRVPTIVRFCKKHRIQIIHCHLPWAGFVGRIVHRLTGIPVVYTEHNVQERYHVGTRLLNRITFNWQSEVVAVSADVAKSIHRKIPVRIPVNTILNGVNTDYFKRDESAAQSLRQSLGIEKHTRVIGTLAVFRFQKRLKEWVEVFAKLSSNDPSLKAIIVGDGPLRKEIEVQIKICGVEGSVIMPGLQTDVKPWMSSMDIFMMSSEFEGLPIALLEAMSMECAVVTTRAGGIPELVEHGVSGLLVDVDQWKELEPQAALVLANEELRRKIAANARKRVEASFSLKGMVGKLEERYTALIGHDHSSRN